MEKELASVFNYFAFFDYFPSFDDVYTFFPKKISKKQLKNELKLTKYTPPQYGIGRKILNIKYQISKRKLNKWRYKMYIKLLSLFPQIKLVGLSGSISMMNAGKDDDIDLFVITEKNRLFTARFIATIVSFIMGLKRSIGQNEAPDKVCLNLFFDEGNLKVPNHKRTEYVAHEILQMKPIIAKGNVYERFLGANLWVYKLFPNATPPVIPAHDRSRGQASTGIQNIGTLRSNFRLDPLLRGDDIETILKKFQLSSINRHRTTEIITFTQLWFHPDDFEKKLKKRSRTTYEVV